MANGVITRKTFLMKGTTSGSTTTWEKLLDIKDYPDLLESPEQVETTTLSDDIRTYTEGLRGNEMKTFTANHKKEFVEAIRALEGEDTPLAVWFGAASDGTTPDGHDGKLKGIGTVSVGLPGAGVGDVRDMTINCIMSVPFDFDDGN